MTSRFWMWLDEDVLRCRVQWICDKNDLLYAGAPTRFKDCPTCGKRMALVGVEWWHERPYVKSLNPRDCY